MTTPFTVTRMWLGETVAILGNAPGLAEQLATAGRPSRAIAINRAVAVAPWADMLVSIDGNWPAEGEDFAGMRIVGIESDVDALYVHLPHEVVTLAPGHVVELRNNALSAMRIAAAAGAVKLVLFGFDPARYEDIHSFPGLAIGLAALIAELHAQGIEVEYYLMPADPPGEEQ
jgi:hypothetical protein